MKNSNNEGTDLATQPAEELAAQGDGQSCINCERLRYALQAFVDYYDQAGIGECQEGHDDDEDEDGFDGDERFNVRLGRAALAAVADEGKSK